MNPVQLTELGHYIDSLNEETLKLEKYLKARDEKKARETKKFILDIQSKIYKLLK